jgi:hypothetical protein
MELSLFSSLQASFWFGDRPALGWLNFLRGAMIRGALIGTGLSMPITLTIADDLANQLKPYEAQLPEILELGIREWRARGENGYQGLNSVLEKLAALPTPQEVLALRPTVLYQERLDQLLEKNRTTGFSADDQREWDQYQYVEHLVRLAKATAIRKLQGTGS